MATNNGASPAGATLAFDAKRDLLAAYATPIINTTLQNAESLNAALRRIVLAREADNPGTTRSNAGGWHSESDLFGWPAPEIRQLAAMIDTLVRRMTGLAASQAPWTGGVRYDAWANVSRRGHYNRMHNHPGAHWSGVYYVDGGDPDTDEGDAGKIEFQDPRGFAQMITTPGKPFGRAYKVRPRPGQILLFPSFIYHCVHPHAGDGARISIAFNALLEDTSATSATPADDSDGEA